MSTQQVIASLPLALPRTHRKKNKPGFGQDDVTPRSDGSYERVSVKRPQCLFAVTMVPVAGLPGIQSSLVCLVYAGCDAYLMATARTCFMSVSPIMTFSMPSIFSVDMPSSTHFKKISATRARS